MTPQEALSKLTALCAGSEQCECQMREKLEKWGVAPREQDVIIQFLYDEKYLDEERFAHAYARDKMRYSQWGRQKIDQHLRMLHISAAARSEALEALPGEEYAAMLEHVLEVKARSLKAESEYERRGKLVRFALGRGFEMEGIMAALDAMK